MQYRKKRKSNARSQETEQASLYAAIDLGTNNCRMLIAKKSKNGFRVVDSFSRITRLGEDVARSSTLSDKAMQRTLKALAICAQKLEYHAVDFVRCVATEACRRAQNGPQFIEDVQNVTGLYLETISPVEEANLALTGCSSLLNSERPNALVFDIGGGSTEIMWIEIKSDGTPEGIDMISLPLGVVTLSET